MLLQRLEKELCNRTMKCVCVCPNQRVSQFTKIGGPGLDQRGNIPRGWHNFLYQHPLLLCWTVETSEEKAVGCWHVGQ